jgi:hypothetical protein
LTSYSDILQDVFAVTMLGGIRNGTFLDIGCNHPVSGNNTYLLEKDYGFTGIAIDWDTTSYNNAWDQDFQKLRPQSQHIQKDALSLDYTQLLGSRVDYLSIDIDPAEQSLAVLKLLPTTTRFSVITFEYEVPRSYVQQESRRYLNELGYELVISNVGNFEDWYVDIQAVDRAIIDKYQSIKDNIQDPKDILGE